MQYIKAQNGIKRRNSVTCNAIEFKFKGEKSINSAVIELSGRYPEEGSSLNTVCEEIIYVIEGTGCIVNPDKTTTLSKGDMIRVESNEKYYLSGNIKLLISSSPAWYPEQYKNV